MSDGVLRVGIIGVGTIAIISHAPALRSTNRAKITAICRRDKEKLRMAQKHLGVDEAYTDWREMLDKAAIDAVLVCTPHHLHAEPTIAALERGLHVQVEKPMALTSQDAWRMVETARRADRVLIATYGARFSGQERTARKALEDGQIGILRQLVVVSADYRRFFWTGGEIPQVWSAIAAQSGIPMAFFEDWGRPGHWFSDPTKMGGGMFADVGSHRVSLALWLGNAPAAEVVAFAEADSLPIECFMSVQARLTNGVLVSLVSANSYPEAAMGRVMWTAIGDNGILTADWQRDLWMDSGGRLEKLEPAVSDVPPVHAFIEAVLDGAPNLSPGKDGALAVALAEAAYQSAAEGRIVKLTGPRQLADL
jgi:predicted dehydrogenase